MLPTSTTLEKEYTNFTLKDIEKALYIYFENIREELNINVKLSIDLLNVDFDSDKYYITFIDKTYYGTNRPTYEEDLILTKKYINKLLTVTNN